MNGPEMREAALQRRGGCGRSLGSGANGRTAVAHRVSPGPGPGLAARGPLGVVVSCRPSHVTAFKPGVLPLCMVRPVSPNL